MVLPERFFISIMTLFRNISVKHNFGRGKKTRMSLGLVYPP